MIQRLSHRFKFGHTELLVVYVSGTSCTIPYIRVSVRILHVCQKPENYMPKHPNDSSKCRNTHDCINLAPLHSYLGYMTT